MLLYSGRRLLKSVLLSLWLHLRKLHNFNDFKVCTITVSCWLRDKGVIYGQLKIHFWSHQTALNPLVLKFGLAIQALSSNLLMLNVLITKLCNHLYKCCMQVMFIWMFLYVSSLIFSGRISWCLLFMKWPFLKMI